MSSRILTLAWETPDLTPTQRLVLCSLAEHTDRQGGSAFPAVRTIAAHCQIAERSVQNALKALLSMELIAVQAPAQRYRPTTYRLFPNGATFEPLAPIEAQQMHPSIKRRRSGHGRNQGCSEGSNQGCNEADSVLVLDTDETRDPDDCATPPAPHASQSKSKSLIDEYHDRFVERVGLKPKINGPKDGKIFKDLERCGESIRPGEGRAFVVDALAEFFAKDADPFYEQTGFAVGAFSGCFNRLVIAVARNSRRAAVQAGQDDYRRTMEDIRQRAEQREQDARKAIVAMSTPAREALKAIAVEEIGPAFRQTMKAEEYERTIKTGMVSALIRFCRYTDIAAGAERFAAEHAPAPELV